MNVLPTTLLATWLYLAALHAPIADAFDLPPVCLPAQPLPEDSAPIAELRARVEKLIETDPQGSVRLMCVTIPRVAREYGEDSVEMAWWVGSLGTPLIAYMDEFAQAIPLLEFARPILERRLGPYAPEVAEIHVAYAWIYYRQGRLAECGEQWEAALRVREHSPGANKIELQKVLVGLAQTRASQRDFARAQAALDRAYAILVENGETVSEAAAAIENTYTNIALRQEDYVTARRHVERQIEIERQMNNAAAQRVPSYALLGQILERLDEYEASERALREAVRLSESKDGPLQRHRLEAQTQLAAMLNERGKPDEALGFARGALAYGESKLGPDAPRLVPVLQNLAEVHRSLGELPEALHLYERATDIVERERADVPKQSLVAYYRGLGSLQLNLGDRDGALTTLSAAIESAGPDAMLSTERARVHLALARAYAGFDAGRSRQELLVALELLHSRLPDSHPAILRVVNELCELELETSPDSTPHCAEAATRLERAREVEPSLRSAVYFNQSRLSEVRGDTAGAYAYGIRALAAAETLGTPDPLWGAYFRLARVLVARDQRSLAIFFGKQSIAEIERLRGYFVGEDRRLDRGFLENKVAVYRAVADWLMESGRLDEGLDVLRLMKTEELYDFVLRDAGQLQSEKSVALTGEEQKLLDRYSQAMQADSAIGAEIDRLSRLREAGRISPNEQTRLETLLAGLGQNEASREDRIRVLLEDSAGAASATTVAGRSVQAEQLERELEIFGPRTALAFYLLTDDGLRIVLATRNGQSEYQVAIAAATLRRDIGHFLEGLSKRENVAAAARSLYETLVRPVDEAAEQAGATRLVLWLDGALRYVPFGALHDGNDYLIDKYAIQIYAESNAGGSGPTADRRQALRVRGLGVTQAVAGYRPLPAVAEELCFVVRGPITGLIVQPSGCPSATAGDGALRGEGFADAAFTEARVRTLLTGPREFSVLHLGTHFSLRPGNAVRSFLLLGDGARLTLDTIGTLDFSGLELMTLSACETAMGGAITDDGREVEGLSTLVQRRGAKRVIASLWQVEDVSTARLMREMYGSLSSVSGDAAEALRRAQQSLRAVKRKGARPYEHPYYWAGFVISSSQP